MKDGDVGGAVYVYINKAGRWDKITPIRLNGTKDSMFGLAVENIGDINQDSYEGNLDFMLWLIFVLSAAVMLQQTITFRFRYCRRCSL